MVCAISRSRSVNVIRATTELTVLNVIILANSFFFPAASLSTFNQRSLEVQLYTEPYLDNQLIVTSLLFFLRKEVNLLTTILRLKIIRNTCTIAIVPGSSYLMKGRFDSACKLLTMAVHLTIILLSLCLNLKISIQRKVIEAFG